MSLCSIHSVDDPGTQSYRRRLARLQEVSVFVQAKRDDTSFKLLSHDERTNIGDPGDSALL